MLQGDRLVNLYFTNTTLLPPALQDSHTPKIRALHLAQQIAARPQRNQRWHMSASTDRPSAGGTARHSALITGCQITELNKLSGLTDNFGLRKFIT